MKVIREYTSEEVCALIRQSLEARRKGFKPVKVVSVTLGLACEGEADPAKIMATVVVEDLPKAAKE